MSHFGLAWKFPNFALNGIYLVPRIAAATPLSSLLSFLLVLLIIQDMIGSVGAKSDQQLNICSFAVRCDQMWHSTQ